MIKNYLLIILRSISRHKLFFAINFLGLTLGLTAFSLITFFIYDEMQYEKFHANYNNLYRLYCEGDSVNPPWKGTPALLAPLLHMKFPEIVGFTRYDELSFGTIKVGDKVYYEKLLHLADSTFFTIFSFKLIKGDPKTALSDLSSIVITEEIAQKLFGSENPIGKEVLLNDKMVFNVTGVSETPPRHSHIQFRYLIPFGNLLKFYGSWAEGWGSRNYTSYLLLKDNSDIKAFREKIKTLQVPRSNGTLVNFNDISIQPFSDIHFSYVRGNDFHTIDRFYLRILLAAAFLIILVACVNYNNLSLAKALHRLRETGIRKVVGASKAKLIFQHTSESVVFMLMGQIFSIVLIESALPLISAYTGIQYGMNYFLLPSQFLFSVVLGFVTGLYPAFFLASFSPYQILKGKLHEGRSIVVVRDILITIQFIAAIALMSCSLVISKQLSYIATANIGLEKENVVTLTLNGEVLPKNIQLIKDRLKALPNVISASGGSFSPGEVNWCQGGYWDGMPKYINNAIYVISTDKDFVETLGIKYLDSIPFKNNQSNLELYILNKTAVKEFGLDQPLGKRFSIYGNPQRGMIVGVVDDYNFKSLHQAMAPCAFIMNNQEDRNIYVRISPANIQRTLDQIKLILLETDPNAAFEYQFLDQQFDQLYANEKRTKAIITLFTFFSLLISVMGIYGLFDFLTEKRVKEISIRKIMGGKSLDILVLILRQPLFLVLVSSAIAIPIAYVIMGEWLQNFAYRIDLTYKPFIVSTLVMIMVSLLAVAKIVLTVVRRNPADTLRYE